MGYDFNVITIKRDTRTAQANATTLWYSPFTEANARSSHLGSHLRITVECSSPLLTVYKLMISDLWGQTEAHWVHQGLAKCKAAHFQHRALWVFQLGSAQFPCKCAFACCARVQSPEQDTKTSPLESVWCELFQFLLKNDKIQYSNNHSGGRLVFPRWLGEIMRG